MTEGEDKGLVLSCASWLWGTVKGGFNEQQSVSQIIVDAVISMIPVVGDVTAVRDLIAVTLRLVQEPERRKQKGEWIQLVILLFALTPVAGGVVKGVGELLMRAGVDVAKSSAKIADIIKVLNRFGEGDAVAWFRKLDLEELMPVVRAKWIELTELVVNVIDRVLVKLRHVLPSSMIEHLQSVQRKLGEVKAAGERMIPDAIKELNARLKQVQHQIHSGEWHEIPSSFKSATREAEARIVVKEGKREWEMVNAHYPQDSIAAYEHVAGWPDLRLVQDSDGRTYVIEAFCGAIRPKKIPGGIKLRRVIDHRNPGGAGSWWTYEMPANGRRWREDCAVLNSFSENKVYIEITVPPEGLWAWEGAASSQIERSTSVATAGQYLPGGGTQLYINFRFEKNAYAKKLVEDTTRHPTNWSDHMNVNIPEQSVTAQELGRHEIATKRTVVQASERLAAKAVRTTEQDGHTQGGAR